MFYKGSAGQDMLSDTVFAKDGTKWERIAPGRGAGRQPAHNVLLEAGGPTAHAKRNIHDKVSAFMCICDRVMLENIRMHTVEEARREGNDESWDLSLPELKAFLAIIYMRGAIGGKNIDMESYWSQKWGNQFMRSTMSRNRFRDIMRFLRFDNRQTRRIRLTTDKFALASEVWDRFRINSIACYKPGAEITVDEQLFPTKARCRFTQYIKSKVEYIDQMPSISFH